MKVFFTKQGKEKVREDNIDAVDLVSPKTIIRIRSTGILIIEKETKKETIIDLDLIEEKEKKK